jgi:glycosyltransferase involved in cell wall biosynthesis
MLNRVRLYFIEKSDGLLLYYEEQKNIFTEKGIDNEKIFHLNNTVDVPGGGYCEAALKRSFVFVGRLQERKKIDLLIESIQIIKMKISNVSLVIVGDGAERGRLEQLAEVKGVSENISFLGRITDHSTLKKIFNESIAYVSPGAVGLGVLHAFGYGCPVITAKKDSNHGPEYYNLDEEENCILTDGSKEDLAFSMIRLMEDTDLMELLGRNAARHYSENRTIGGMVEKTVSAINSIYSNFERKNSEE